MLPGGPLINPELLWRMLLRVALPPSMRASKPSTAAKRAWKEGDFIVLSPYARRCRVILAPWPILRTTLIAT